MVEAHQEIGGSVVATMQVGPDAISKYGVVDVAEQDGQLVRMRGMIEKPDAKDAPSDLAVIGRYILTPRVMKNLASMKQGSGGEIQLTDAIADEIRMGHDVHGYQFDGVRYDCGTKAGFLQATVAFALARPDLRDEFGAFLETIVDKAPAAKRA